MATHVRVICPVNLNLPAVDLLMHNRGSVHRLCISKVLEEDHLTIVKSHGFREDALTPCFERVLHLCKPSLLPVSNKPMIGEDINIVSKERSILLSPMKIERSW